MKTPSREPTNRNFSSELESIIITLNTDNTQLEAEVKKNLNEISAFETQLSQITESKFFNLWQLYCSIRNFFVTNNRHDKKK